MFTSRRILTQGIRHFSSSSARADIARMTLVGRIGGDLASQVANSGKEYLRYPLAVQTSKSETSWFNVTVFDAAAINFMKEYLTKGSTVYVEADAAIQLYQIEAEDGAVQNRQNLSLIQQTISPIVWKPGKRTEAEADTTA